MESQLDDAIPPKHCPLINSECLQDRCVFWIRSTESVRKNCAVVIIAQQLNVLAGKSTEGRVG
jgi:hypothetical protein